VCRCVVAIVCWRSGRGRCGRNIAGVEVLVALVPAFVVLSIESLPARQREDFFFLTAEALRAAWGPARTVQHRGRFRPVDARRDAVRSSSGSLAMLTAMRRASSRVTIFAAESPAGFVLEIDVGERVAVAVADDVAVLAELGVRVIDRPGRREAAPRLGLEQLADDGGALLRDFFAYCLGAVLTALSGAGPRGSSRSSMHLLRKASRASPCSRS
jgi:hypothetical protein